MLISNRLENLETDLTNGFVFDLLYKSSRNWDKKKKVDWNF